MLEEDVPKAKAALKSANLRVIGTERVNATFGVMFHDPIFGRARIMYDLVTVQLRAKMESAAGDRAPSRTAHSAGGRPRQMSVVQGRGQGRGPPGPGP